MENTIHFNMKHLFFIDDQTKCRLLTYGIQNRRHFPVYSWTFLGTVEKDYSSWELLKFLHFIHISVHPISHCICVNVETHNEIMNEQSFNGRQISVEATGFNWIFIVSPQSNAGSSLADTDVRKTRSLPIKHVLLVVCISDKK